MASFQKFHKFVENLAEEKFNLGSDQLQLALTNAANPPSSTGDGVLTDLTQIAYTNLSAQTVTTSASAQTGGIYALVVADKVLTASGNVAAFQYVVLFDQDAPSDELIGYYDYGSEVTLTAGETFTVDFSSSVLTIQ